MTIHIVTIFPEFFSGPFEHGILRRSDNFCSLVLAIHAINAFHVLKTHRDCYAFASPAEEQLP